MASAYGDLLSKLGAGGAGGAQPAAMGVGAGAAPDMPNLPPPPTMTGQIPTGSPGTTKKGAADNAIVALRELQGHFPSLGPSLERAIDEIKSASKAPESGSSLGKPSPPGATPPAVNPTELSGSPGAM